MSSITSKNIQKFYCSNCDFVCSKKGDWNRHTSTAKHKKATESTDGNTKIHQMHECSGCGKFYNDRTGLWRHKKKCIYSEDDIIENVVSDESNSHNVVTLLLNQNMELIKQNQEFKDLIVDQNKKMLEIAKEAKTINNTTNNTTNNNSFNLQFFLNEQCKDALNITDFINQLQLKIADLDMVGRVGYTEGISQLFIRGLKELDVHKRPIHCCDIKREVLYVKDKNAWEKDNEQKEKMKIAIKRVAAKNFKQINEWREENPSSDDTDSKKHMEYHNIVINSMGGSNQEEDEKNYNKIIKNVAKEVVIEKESKEIKE
jgi:hypothetical protein